MAIFPPGIDRSITFNTGLPTPMLSPGSRQLPTRENWKQAEIRMTGFVKFFDRPPWYPFEVLRENVVRLWPGQLRSKHRRPASDRVREVIGELWPNGIPPTLSSKERDHEIAAAYERKGYAVQSTQALIRTIQRVLKEEGY
jgi:hypothetical protein